MAMTTSPGPRCPEDLNPKLPRRGYRESVESAIASGEAAEEIELQQEDYRSAGSCQVRSMFEISPIPDPDRSQIRSESSTSVFQTRSRLQ